MNKYKYPVSLREITGKNVISDGRTVGKVKDIYMKPSDLSIIGISIESSIEYRLFIEKGEIKTIGKDGVFLIRTPLRDFLGQSVYDFSGKVIGEVREMRRVPKTSAIVSLTVDIGSKEITIQRSAINEEMIQKGIWLKHSKGIL